jgi:hypothetical protein
MAKFSFPSKEMEKMIQKVSKELGLESYGIEVMPLNLRKSKVVTKIARAGEIAEIASERSNLLALIVYERAFERVDEQTQEMWIRIALNKVKYDYEKDKIEIVDDVRNIIEMSKQYKDVVLQKVELGYLTIEQILEEEREEKERQKEERAAKRAAKKIAK